MKSRNHSGPGRGRKLLFFIIILTAFCLVAELGWRTYLYSSGKGFFDDPREFTSPFFTTYQEPMPFFTDDGFIYHRNALLPREKKPNEIRILCFGGSTTVNWRARISYADLLEKKLGNDENRLVRVMNVGGEGFSTAHTLVNLALRNLEAQADIITVFHNINDYTANYWEFTPDYSNKYKQDFYLSYRHRTGPVAELTKVSRLARFILFKIRALRFPKEVRQFDRVQEFSRGQTQFRRNLRSIIAVARAHGSRVVLATQPGRSDLRRQKIFVSYNETIREVAELESVPLVDLEATIREPEYFLDDALHFTRRGVEMVAEEFHKVLSGIVEEVAAEQATRGQVTF